MRIRKIAFPLFAALLLAALPGFPQAPATRQQQIAAHARQAQEYLSENKLDLAETEFKALVALDPKNADALGNLGVVEFFQGKYAEAIPQLRAALKLLPGIGKIQALLGIAEKRTGDSKNARDDLEKAFPKVQEKNIRLETGMELIDLDSQAGDLDKAAVAIGALREMEPANEAVLYTAYRVYSQLTDESILSMMVVAPNSAHMHEIMGHELARHGHTEEAIENFRAAIKIDPQLPALHYELAEMLNASADTREEAASEYRKALALNPLDEASECRLGDIAAQKNDLNEAYNRYTRAVQLNPDDPEAGLGLARVLMSRGQPEKALPLLENAVKLDPTNATAHFRLSTLCRRLERTDEAQSELDQYQKYKEMKNKLRDLYHTMRVEPAKQESEETESRYEK